MSDFQFSRSLQQFAVERMAIQNFIIRMEDMGVLNARKAPRGDDVIYNNAIIEAIKTDTRFLEQFMEGNKSVRFRKHKRNEKGKLVSVEAYYYM